MENQNGLKLRISRMFRSSFGSCKSRENSDVLGRPQNRQHHQLIELFSPRTRPFSSTCRPRCSETEIFPRSKVSDRNSLLAPASGTGGGKCPPVSPGSPLNSFFEFQESDKKKKEKKSRRTKTTRKTTSQLMKKGVSFESFDNYYDWFSSSDDDDDDDYSEVIEVDDDETTLFSSKSLSSDSSESLRRNKARYRLKRAPTKKKKKKKSEKGPNPMPALHGKVKDSFVVVKRSSDPYNDFRTSMVEMIVERQIFGARDLENLLQTFLSLNSNHHRRVIIEVFTEIWETLFCNWS